MIVAGTTIAIGAAGIAISSEEASAAVTGAFSVGDATIRPADNRLAQLWATVSGDWRFGGLEADPAEWRVYLLADATGNPGDWQAIAMTSGSVTAREASGTYGIRGEITAASHYQSIDVSDGTPVELSIPVSVLLMVRDGSGETLATAEAMDTVTVTVEPGGSVSAIGGSGTMHGVDNAGDPTPTVPEP